MRVAPPDPVIEDLSEEEGAAFLPAVEVLDARVAGGEQEAEAELARGAGVVYRSTEDFISHLESVLPAESD